MTKYLQEAMKKFLKDNGVSCGEINDDESDSVTFEWISASISIKTLEDFETEFHIFQTSSSGIKGDKWLNVEFDFTSN